MLERIAGVLRFSLSLLVLVTLHLVHGSTLLVSLFVHLVTSLQSGASRLSSESLEEDTVRWSTKKPAHLALIFVPAARGKFEWRQFRYRPWEEHVVLEGMVEDIQELVRWCKKLGISSLTIYDEQDILKRNSPIIREALDNSYDALALSSSVFIIDDSLRISLLASEDGKEHVGRVAGSLSKAVKANHISQVEVTVALLQEKLESSLCPEPELLIVLGGLHLRLRGFPPWHVRLCEIYHDSSLGLLGPPRLRYSAFRNAMDAFAGCERRLGR